MNKPGLMITRLWNSLQDIRRHLQCLQHLSKHLKHHQQYQQQAVKIPGAFNRFTQAEASNNFWYLPSNALDARGRWNERNGGKLSIINGAYSWANNTEIRNEVSSVEGIPQSAINGDHATYRRQGYMYNNLDWKNIEMTAYYRATHGSGSHNGSAHIESVMRGGYNSAQYPCSASNYHMNIYYVDEKGAPRDEVHVEKDQWHGRKGSPQGYSKISPKTLNVGAGAAIEGKWFGWKTVVYNNSNGTLTIEAYIDNTTDGIKPGTFHKVFSFTDSTGKMGNCKGSTDSCVEQDCQLPITYGGPIVNFRWDNMKDMQFKWLSVREIRPPSSHGPDTTGTTSKVAYAYPSYAGRRLLYTGPEGYIPTYPGPEGYNI